MIQTSILSLFEWLFIVITNILLLALMSPAQLIASNWLFDGPVVRLQQQQSWLVHSFFVFAFFYY